MTDETPFRVLVADDEPLARQRLRTLLADDPEVVLVAECEHGPAARETLQHGEVDLAFLDVRMPGADGFEVLDAIPPDARPLVVFCTAYQEFAVRAFEVHAFDYLLKPYERARFRDALARAKTTLRQRREQGCTTPVAPASSDPAVAAGRLAVRTGGRVRLLALDEILCLQADDTSVHLRTRGGVVTARDTLTSLELRLPSDRFLRIHRSTIVNLGSVREVQPWFHGDYVLILEDGSQVTTGRRYRSRLRSMLP